MAKRGKNQRQVRERVEQREYALAEAIGFLKEASYTKFDETLEGGLAFQLEVGRFLRELGQDVAGLIADIRGIYVGRVQQVSLASRAWTLCLPGIVGLITLLIQLKE